MEGVLTTLGRIAGAGRLQEWAVASFFLLIFAYSLSISYTPTDTVYFGLFLHLLLPSASLSHPDRPFLLIKPRQTSTFFSVCLF